MNGITRADNAPALVAAAERDLSEHLAESFTLMHAALRTAQTALLTIPGYAGTKPAAQIRAALELSTGLGHRIACARQHGLPATIDTLAAFRAAYSVVVEFGYARLRDDAAELDYSDLRTDLDNSIRETLAFIGVPEPEGDSLDWMEPLHDIVLTLYPAIGDCLDD